MSEIEAAPGRPDELWNEQLAGDLTVDEWCDYWLSEKRHWDGDGFNVGDALVDLQASAAMIRKMKAALVRPDDATPVTPEWLKASGIPFNTTTVGGGPSRVWNLLFDSPRGGKRVVVPVEAVPMRGDARAVCLGLGIPLTGDVR